MSRRIALDTRTFEIAVTEFRGKPRGKGRRFAIVISRFNENVTDRLLPSRLHVIDFIYFYVNTASGELGFPAFNIADSAICVGVGLIFWATWKSEQNNKPATTPSTGES